MDGEYISSCLQIINDAVILHTDHSPHIDYQRCRRLHSAVIPSRSEQTERRQGSRSHLDYRHHLLTDLAVYLRLLHFRCFLMAARILRRLVLPLI
jgi:hypothetical protein